MFKNHKLLFIFSLLIFLLCCTKKIFRRIEVKGVLMDYFTNQPIPSSVTVSGYTGKESDPWKELKTEDTDQNGSFEIRTSAVKEGKYLLHFRGKKAFPFKNIPENTGQIYSIAIRDGSTKDLGQLFESTHTFYCKATVTHTSSLPYDFYISDPFPTDNYIHFNGCPTGAVNSFVYYRGITKKEYEDNNHNFIFHYGLIGPSITGGGTISMPIQNNKDTVYANIEY